MSKWRDLAKNTLVGLVIAGVTALVVLAALELYFRYQIPFGSISWPSRFDPKIGFIFTPDAEVRWTNNLDYWTIQRVNKWGFLDREPEETPAASSQCGIAFIGNSFIEAAQVPIPEKVQAVLETLAHEKAPALNVVTSAFGYSGTGQLNQLPFYDEFARKLKPKVVVLVFVSNDFANNSKVLEALRNGWDPDREPRVFATQDSLGKIILQPIDPKWEEVTLTAPPSRQSIRALYHGRLTQRSAFYRWLYAKLALLHPTIANFLSGGGSGINLTDFYAQQLVQRPRYHDILEGWDPLREPDIDQPFNSEQMAPVFQEAVGYTGFAFDQYLERARRDNFQLVVLATSTLATESGKAWQLERLSILLKARGIPLIDQGAYIASVGGTLSQARFAHDGHWSPQGHRWAAEAMLKFLTENPQYCSSTTSSVRQ